MSHVAIGRGDFQLARALAEESLAGHRAAGFPKGEAQALTSLAIAARAEGDLQGALELLDESRRIVESIGFRWWLTGVLAITAEVFLELGRLEDARRSAQQALSFSQPMRDRRAVVYELGLLAQISASAGDTHQAGLLRGAAEAENERMPVGRWIHGHLERARESALPHGHPDFERGRASGREISLEDATALALERGDS
jgi:tetratricopeptide (TPR) repeat protein